MNLFSWLVYAAMASGLLAFLLFMAWWLGEKHRTRNKAIPYECGIIPSGTARFKFPASYYLVAIFFLLFDIEGIFIFSWAVAAKQLGIFGWIQITFFIFVLLISLFYVWAKGGLTWGKSAPHNHRD